MPFQRQPKPRRAAVQTGGVFQDVHQVKVIKLGSSRLISQAGDRWDDLFTTGPSASPDFMLTREQLPERDGGRL